MYQLQTVIQPFHVIHYTLIPTSTDLKVLEGLKARKRRRASSHIQQAGNLVRDIISDVRPHEDVSDELFPMFETWAERSMLLRASANRIGEERVPRHWVHRTLDLLASFKNSLISG